VANTQHKVALEPVTVRERHRRGGRPREGLDYTWTEWQVVSGRRVVSRHDFEHQAVAAADQLRNDRATASVSLATWADREGISIRRAEQLLALKVITGERHPQFGMMVACDTKAPKNSRRLNKRLGLLALRRPAWVPNFHANFPRLRANTDTTLTKIAAELNVGSNAVSHWHTGRNYPIAERLPQLARILGVTVKDLIGKPKC
jgi:hypothetical protein